MQTIRLTAAQALVRFLAAQMTEVDGAKLPVFAGAWASEALADRRLGD